MTFTALTAIRHLRSIDFPADPIEGPDFIRSMGWGSSSALDIENAIRAIFRRSMTDLSDSDWDTLDDILYPAP